MPAATSASASGTVAAQMPIAPAAICRWAIAGHLCVLACGRKPHFACRQWSAILAMLASKASRSTTSAGVGIVALVKSPRFSTAAKAAGRRGDRCRSNARAHGRAQKGSAVHGDPLW